MTNCGLEDCVNVYWGMELGSEYAFEEDEVGNEMSKCFVPYARHPVL